MISFAAAAAAAAQGRTLIERVVPGFAAARSEQLQAGDEVLSVDGVPVQEWALEAIKRLTVGEEGTAVALEVQRGPNVLRVALRRRFPESVNDINLEAQQILAGGEQRPPAPASGQSGLGRTN